MTNLDRGSAKLSDIHRSRFSAGDIFSFNKFITPVMIKILFFVLILFLAIYSVSAIYEAVSSESGFFGIILSILKAMAQVVVSYVVIRLIFESLLLMFDIRRNLQELNDKSGR